MKTRHIYTNCRCLEISAFLKSLFTTSATVVTICISAKFNSLEFNWLYGTHKFKRLVLKDRDLSMVTTPCKALSYDMKMMLTTNLFIYVYTSQYTHAPACIATV